MDKIYLITGAPGHLGSTVTLNLTEAGKTVRVLALPKEKNIPPGADVYYGDIRFKETVERCFGNLKGRSLVVIHCAGVVSITSGFNQNMYDVNVTGTKNVVDLCMRHGASKLIYVSSVHAIPEMPRGAVISEVSEFDPDSVIGGYAKTKAEASAYALNASGEGLNVCIVHPSGIIGPYDNVGGHTTTLVIDYCKGRLIAGIKGGYDFVDVRDVAAGILSVCEKGKKGECYILSNRYFKISEIFRLLHEITGRREIKIYLPPRFIKATAPIAEYYYKMLRQPPLFTPYSIYTLNSNALFSRNKAETELGYTTRDMKETLTDTVNWLRENKRI